MASHDESHAHAPDGGTPREHPMLPPVHDEAPETPMWVPITGLALLAFLVVFALIRSASSGGAPDAGGAEAGAGAEIVEGVPVPAQAAPTAQD